MTRVLHVLLPVFAILLISTTARADERIAVVIGNNRGESDEARLRFAESDAEKFGVVMRELGGVAPDNLVVLLGEDASTVRSALLRVNERIRALPAGSASLFVFYSGHADAEALHLRGTTLPLQEVESLVNGSPAGFRFLVVDACRSGALTRVKGGMAVAPAALRISQDNPAEGAVFLTASAATEDAQESDAIRGSFFTHYLVTALRGAGDTNHDGNVDLDEAYRFAYLQTIRASSRSMAGLQHPTYRHDMKGRGDVVLTRWNQARRQGLVVLPKGGQWLLFQGNEEGPVVAEIVAGSAERTVSLSAGRYFVRGRTEKALREGEFTLAEGATVQVAAVPLTEIAYARLVRKGGSNAPSAAHSLSLSYRLQGPIDGGDLCHGGILAYILDFPVLTFSARVGGCVGGFSNANVQATTFDLDAELHLGLVFDFAWFTFELGGGIGGAWLGQRFDSRGIAPDRDAFAITSSGGIGISRDLSGPVFLTIEAYSMSYIWPGRTSSGGTAPITNLLRLTVGLGWHF